MYILKRFKTFSLSSPTQFQFECHISDTRNAVIFYKRNNKLLDCHKSPAWVIDPSLITTPSRYPVVHLLIKLANKMCIK